MRRQEWALVAVMCSLAGGVAAGSGEWLSTVVLVIASVLAAVGTTLESSG